MTWRPHLTEAEHEQIADLFRAITSENGTPPPACAIAAKVGRSKKTVMASLVASDLVKRGPRRLTAAERKRIIKLYLTRRNGRWLSCVEVGKRVGRSAVAVLRVVQAAGVVRTRGEALADPIPPETHERVLRLRQETGWSHDKIAAELAIKPHLARKVLDESNTRVPVGTPHARAGLRADEIGLLLDLYRQGQSALEVAERTGRNERLVRQLVNEAGLMRTSSETTLMVRLRRGAQQWLDSMDARPLAERWLAGEDVEDLAAELNIPADLDIPADLLWDRLADRIATMTPPPPREDTGARCVGCLFACKASCAEPGDVVVAYRWTGVGYSKIAGHLNAAVADGVLEDGDVIVRAGLGGTVEVDARPDAPSTAVATAMANVT